MKNPYFIPFAALVLFAATGCDRKSPEISEKLAELERKNNEATTRQRELERELEEQKLAVERDSIERERARIEADRVALEREQGEAAAAQEEAIRKREEELAGREGKLEKFQITLEEKQDDLAAKSAKLSDKEREMAGREALPFEPVEQREPVADYGTFYDSLGSYGSWFETDDYGYVWQPVAVRDSNWRPYSRGRWACSDRGWTWISDEPFGWATYHYGRWALLRGRGWIWVPGTEWAPSWVSWRENDNCIGWAPLPPETLAYRGQAWDSTVDVQFGIGAAWFSFVEIRNFGSPVYNHCLPVSGNGGYYQQTTNITYIHIQNRQVICGGPKYKRVSDRIGKPVPFYRIGMQTQTHSGRGSSDMRSRVVGDRLMVSAPNIDARWNEGLRPKQVRGRMDSVKVERDRELSHEISGRFRQSRQEARERADSTIDELGGSEKFQQRRREQLQQSREKVNPKSVREEIREVAVERDRPQREVAGNREPQRNDRPEDGSEKNDQVAGNVPRRPNADRNSPQDSEQGNGAGRPMITPRPDTNIRQDQRQDRRPNIMPERKDDRQPNIMPDQNEDQQPNITPDENPDRQEDDRQRQQEDNNRREQQRQTDRQRETQQETMRRGQEQQTQQRQQTEKQQTEKQQRDAEQARKQVQEQERGQRQQQENEKRQQQERAQRQQEAEQQREMQRQRQQEEARRQQQEENRRQQQQEENQRQRQEEMQRQRQQEENQRQRQQEESQQRQRQQEENQRQKQQRDEEDRRGRNR